MVNGESTVKLWKKNNFCPAIDTIKLMGREEATRPFHAPYRDVFEVNIYKSSPLEVSPEINSMDERERAPM